MRPSWRADAVALAATSQADGSAALYGGYLAEVVS